MDSLDWIWQDFRTADNLNRITEPVDQSDDDFDFQGIDDDGSGSVRSDLGSDSSVGFTMIVTDANAARELREIVRDTEVVIVEGDPADDEAEYESITVEDLEEADYEFVNRFYIDALDAVKSKISEVRLVWADALYQYTTNEKNVPESYMKTTNIEKLVLLYASNFIEQFRIKYPNRRPLSLVLENECGVQKCICTTIKPSRFVYHDLNDLISYSEFVSKYLTYMKLEDPTTVPKKIMSPSTTLEIQTANCFELAILLASFLIGLGYNAFVVQGYATEIMCNNDLSRIKLDMPKYDCEPKSHESDDAEDVDNFAVDFKLDMSNAFTTFLIEEEKKKLIVEDEVKENNLDGSSDPLYGRRVHCWVMIIPLEEKDGEHSDTTPYFIEPSVGEKKEVSDKSYIGIESIWNHNNYWINLQPLGNGCTEYDFTVTNEKCWEQFLPDKTQNRQGSTLDDGHDESERNVIMPNSWVSVLEVPSNKYRMLYPLGKKTTRYMNALKESYAEYILPDGLIERITFYAEPEYERKVYVKESYSHRVDKLISVETRFFVDKIQVETVEHFSSGRKDYLKMHTFSGNSNSLYTKRSCVFDNLRDDSMIELEIDSDSFTATFSNRSDLLFWRSSEFENPELLDDRVINYRRKVRMIAESYLRDRSKHKDRDIASIRFHLSNDNIYVLHQYGEEHITQSKRLFFKPTGTNNTVFGHTSVYENIVNPYEGHLELHESYTMFQELLEAEVKAIRAVSKLEDEVIKFLENRSREQSGRKLKVDSLDWDRNHKIRNFFQNKKDKKLAVAKRDDEEKIDYALPYLELSKKPYTYDQVLKIRDKVISKFRQNTNNQFIRAKNAFMKKESKMRSITKALEENNLEGAALEHNISILYSSLKNDLEVLTMKMQRYKETRAERYNNLVTYLNSKPEFKIVPPLKLLDLNGT